MSPLGQAIAGHYEGPRECEESGGHPEVENVHSMIPFHLAFTRTKRAVERPAADVADSGDVGVARCNVKHPGVRSAVACMGGLHCRSHAWNAAR
jgi:hypothetical protein